MRGEFALMYEVVPDVIMASTLCKRCGRNCVLRLDDRYCMSCKSELRIMMGDNKFEEFLGECVSYDSWKMRRYGH